MGQGNDKVMDTKPRLAIFKPRKVTFYTQVLLTSILLWKGNKMEGCRLSPGVHISAVTVASGTVAQLFHCDVSPHNSNSLCCVV